MLTQLLIGLALAAESTWWREPVVLELEPAGPDYIGRHRQLMDARAAGRGANPTFRAPWTRMEAHWAMVSAGDEAGLLISQEEASRYRDLALVAATMASQDLLNETIDRSDVLRGMRTALRSVTSPSVQLRKEAGEGLVLRASQAPAVQRGALIAAAIAEPNAPVGGAVRPTPSPPGSGEARPARRSVRAEPPPRPRLNMGFAGGASTGAVTDGTGAPTGDVTLTLAWSAYIQARDLGVDALRLSGSVLSWEPFSPDSVVAPFQSSAWTLSARERFLPRWTALADARSVSGQLALDTVRPGLAWQVIGHNPRWYLQGTYTYGLSTPSRRSPESTAALRLFWTGRWISPSAPDEWPLGYRPGYGGPVWPDEPPPRSSEATALVLTPAERYADAAPGPPETYARVDALRTP